MPIPDVFGSSKEKICEYCAGPISVHDRIKSDLFGQLYHEKCYEILRSNDPYFGSYEFRKDWNIKDYGKG